MYLIYQNFVLIIYYLFMQQNHQNHTTSKCQLHSFSLKSYSKQTRYNFNVTAKMCSKKELKKAKMKGACTYFQGPIFNKDKCHATNTFIVGSQRIELQKTRKAWIEEHNMKVKDYQQTDELLIPKPNSKSMYCNVCRQHYQQYLEHINSSKHRERIKHSIHNRFILELEKLFQKKNRTQNIIVCNDAAKLNTEDQPQIEPKSRKIIKKDTNVEYNVPIYPFFAPGLNTANENLNPYFGSINPYFSYPFFNNFGANYPIYVGPYQPSINIGIIQQRF